LDWNDQPVTIESPPSAADRLQAKRPKAMSPNKTHLGKKGLIKLASSKP